MHLGTSRHGGHSLVEMMIAVAIAAVLFGTTMGFFRTSNQQIVKVSDHAQARMNAMAILDTIHDDMMRIVVSDSMTDLITPVQIDQATRRSIWFRALHHKKIITVAGGKKEMKLVARKIRYGLKKITGGGGEGYWVTRNDKELRAPGGTRFLDPVADLRFQEMSPEKACQLGIAPFHAIEIEIKPRGVWDTYNKALSQFNSQKRLVHLTDLEAQFACLISIKKANAPMALQVMYGIDRVDLPWPGTCPILEQQTNMAMDWVRPPGLVQYDDRDFDDATANIDEGA